MSLSARLDNPPPRPVHGYPCSVGKLREELPTDEQAALDRILWELDWSDRHRFEQITDDGHRVARSSITAHRRRECRCFAAGSA